eukprot:CAMPEP_0184967494 /NCGR_PEP_ID=MMETSP1098-20130426/858_1 /TAXON_ID=89044 /ORGANISM="Spumella elongata, Strain CCAP 955/1" /LENGTH=114 /DNA_ID=CAMNT_0027488965 /DNA_START=94 /DNA_END=438 /DNA_ORIENTATION=+
MMLPKAPKDRMVKILQQHAKIVLDSGGNYRGVENHGIRPLPERTRRTFAVVDGPRYFWEARYLTATFDASPAALVEIGRMFRNEENVLRAFTIKRKSTVFQSSGGNYKNPYFNL